LQRETEGLLPEAVVAYEREQQKEFKCDLVMDRLSDHRFVPRRLQRPPCGQGIE
jgi:hypothetical protein